MKMKAMESLLTTFVYNDAIRLTHPRVLFQRFCSSSFHTVGEIQVGGCEK